MTACRSLSALAIAHALASYNYTIILSSCSIRSAPYSLLAGWWAACARVYISLATTYAASCIASYTVPRTYSSFFTEYILLTYVTSYVPSRRSQANLLRSLLATSICHKSHRGHCYSSQTCIAANRQGTMHRSIRLREAGSERHV